MVCSSFGEVITRVVCFYTRGWGRATVTGTGGGRRVRRIITRMVPSNSRKNGIAGGGPKHPGGISKLVLTRGPRCFVSRPGSIARTVDGLSTIREGY